MEQWERQNGLLMILAAVLICILAAWSLWELAAGGKRTPEGRNTVLVRIEKGEAGHG